MHREYNIMLTAVTVNLAVAAIKPRNARGIVTKN